MIHVTYRNTLADLLWFNFHHAVRSPTNIALVLGLMGMIALIFFQARPKDESLLVNIIVFFILEGAALLAYALLTGFLVLLQVASKKNKTVLTEHTLELRDDALVTETAYAKTECKWATVQRLRRTRDYLFIYVSANSANLVPRRAFADEDCWNAFFDFCKSKTAGVHAP